MLQVLKEGAQPVVGSKPLNRFPSRAYTANAAAKGPHFKDSIVRELVRSLKKWSNGVSIRPASAVAACPDYAERDILEMSENRAHHGSTRHSPELGIVAKGMGTYGLLQASALASQASPSHGIADCMPA